MLKSLGLRQTHKELLVEFILSISTVHIRLLRLLLLLTFNIAFDLWQENAALLVSLQSRDLNQDIARKNFTLEHKVVLLGWKVAFDTQATVFTSDFLRIIWPIEDFNDIFGHLIQLALISVKAMIDHEMNHNEYLIGHLILFFLLKLHNPFCALQKLQTKVFQSDICSWNVCLLGLDWITKGTIFDLIKHYLSLDIQFGKLIPNHCFAGNNQRLEPVTIEENAQVKSDQARSEFKGKLGRFQQLKSNFLVINLLNNCLRLYISTKTHFC